MFLLIKFTLLYAVVLMLVAMGGMFSERSGVINIALEGIMAIGGLAGVFVLVLFPDLPAPALVALSILASAVSGMIYSLLLGFSAITLKADQTIGGTALNMLATAIAIVLVKAFNNGSDAALDASMLAGDYAAKLGAEGPQVLIIHTHGSESYTMPPGQEYDVSDTFRTLDTNCNMIRIGDEMAQVLTDAGIGVVHDRSLYDYPSYSGAYNRSLASIESYLQKYPSISFVLDVHRDAVQDANGQQFKLLCGEDKNAAQLEFVIGSNGGGLSHDLWRENLKLACAVQETLYKDYPTLMRPVTVRNSRYNQHMTTGSLLVEVGTAGNSLEEAVNAARLFAAGFAKTIQNGT